MSHLGDSGINLREVTGETPTDSRPSLLPASSPVIAHEDEGGKTKGRLQPAPVRDEVGQQGDDQEADADEHLVNDSHKPPLLHANNLRDYRSTGEHVTGVQVKPSKGRGRFRVNG